MSDAQLTLDELCDALSLLKEGGAISGWEIQIPNWSPCYVKLVCCGPWSSISMERVTKSLGVNVRVDCSSTATAVVDVIRKHGPNGQEKNQ